MSHEIANNRFGEDVMRILILWVAVFLLADRWLQPVNGQAAGSSPSLSKKPSCDFSRYKPLHEAHALPKAVLQKVEPIYPPLAKEARASGKVVVKILVNKRGKVVRTCLVEGHPLLRATALRAAAGWKFKRNFGFIDYKPRARFAETDLTFDFQLLK